jgi:L-threonylcarbamoyladenylate synthase
MKIIPRAEALSRVGEIASALAGGGIASFPLGGSYRLAADLGAPEVVNRLFQTKRRAKSHPALVLVPSLAAAKPVVDGTAWATTRRLAEKLWPGALTIVLPPCDQLPSAVRRALTKATGKLGVRVPDDPLATAILAAFGRPLLLSSANVENKPGAASAATVRQRFGTSVEVWVDAGDVPAAPPSTLIEPTADAWTILREGAVARADIERVLGGLAR